MLAGFYSFFVFAPGLTSVKSIPHFGHLPGLLLTTSGCIGQLYVLAFTRSIPHFGHFPGLSLITSGCIGQVYLADCTVSFFAAVVPLQHDWAIVAYDAVTAINKKINFFIFVLFIIENDLIIF
jgi:hypothetical protein